MHDEVEIDTGLFLLEVGDAIEESRLEFPGRHNRLIALIKKLETLIETSIQHRDGLGASEGDVRRTAIAVAALAVRFGTEGDAAFFPSPTTDKAENRGDAMPCQEPTTTPKAGGPTA